MAPSDPRSPLSVGVGWAYKITSIGLEFTVPALIGLGIDAWIDSTPWGLLIGASLGFMIGLAELLRISRNIAHTNPRNRSD